MDLTGFLLGPFLTGVLVFVMLVLIVLMVKTFVHKNPYVIELVLMSPGINKHLRVRTDSLEFKHHFGNKDYEINPESVFRVRPSFIDSFIIWRLLGIKAKYMTLYRFNKTEPIEFETAEVDAFLLETVRKSRALSKGLTSEWKVPFDVQTGIVFLGFAVVVIIGLLMATGQLKLS